MFNDFVNPSENYSRAIKMCLRAILWMHSVPNFFPLPNLEKSDSFRKSELETLSALQAVLLLSTR